MQSVNRLQEMRFRSGGCLKEFETMSSRMCRLENACRLRQSQVCCVVCFVDVQLQRIQSAIATSLLLNMSSTVLSLSEVLSGVSCDEEEEGSSTYEIDQYEMIDQGRSASP